MADFIESARAILSVSEKRMETAANNVANLTTPGFKSQKLYSETLASFGTGAAPSNQQLLSDLAPGRLSKSGNPLDLAINGNGYFRVSSADRSYYSRNGQFSLARDGRVVDAKGLALQQVDGGDLVLDSSNVLITADGTVISQGRPIAKIAIYKPASDQQVHALGGSLFAIDDSVIEAVGEPDIRQGMVEASNVSLGDEMVTMMEALRHAENGARLVQVYDDLMGKAISNFGQGGR